jgi:hypothetical protein
MKPPTSASCAAWIASATFLTKNFQPLMGLKMPDGGQKRGKVKKGQLP